MKNSMNLMLMLVLACSMSAVAQSGMSSDSSMNNGSGKKMSMTGCVAEKDGKYMLKTKKHPDGMMLMGSEDMKPHVGHEVMVTGMMQKMDTSGGSMSSGSSMPSGEMMQMNVTSVKMVSDTCAMGGMSK
jgi:hypothetical protein